MKDYYPEAGRMDRAVKLQTKRQDALRFLLLGIEAEVIAIDADEVNP